jgi:voltage-gated sodium channel
VAIAGVIIVNAIVLGLETFPTVMASYGDQLILANEVCYGIFVVELILRFASYGKRPQDFFKSGWNIFDLIIIGGVWIPGVRENPMQRRKHPRLADLVSQLMALLKLDAHSEVH